MPQFVSTLSKRTSLWRHPSLKICQKKMLPVNCFFSDKVVSNIHQIYRICFILWTWSILTWFSLESPGVARKYIFTCFNAEKDRTNCICTNCICTNCICNKCTNCICTSCICTKCTNCICSFPRIQR